MTLQQLMLCVIYQWPAEHTSVARHRSSLSWQQCACWAYSTVTMYTLRITLSYPSMATPPIPSFILPKLHISYSIDPSPCQAPSYYLTVFLPLYPLLPYCYHAPASSIILLFLCHSIYFPTVVMLLCPLLSCHDHHT